MNDDDLSRALNDLNDEVENLERRYRLLWVKLEQELTRKEEETATALSIDLSGSTKDVKDDNDSQSASTADLESYLDDVIKKSSELRIKHCRLDFDNDLDYLNDSESEDLTLLVNETTIAEEERKRLEVERGKSRGRLRVTGGNQRCSAPLSARERGRAYKPPPLPKSRGYQTTYRASFKPSSGRSTYQMSSRRSTSSLTKNVDKIPCGQKVNTDASKAHSFDSDPYRKRMAYVSNTGMQEDASNVAIYQSIEQVSSSTGSEDVETVLNSKHDTKEVEHNSKTVANWKGDEADVASIGSIHQNESKARTEHQSIRQIQNRPAFDWPPTCSRRDKQRQLLRAESIPGELLKLNAKYLRCSKNVSSLSSKEVDKSCRELTEYFNSLSETNVDLSEILPIEADVQKIELEILELINSGTRGTSETRSILSSRLIYLEQKLNSFATYPETDSSQFMNIDDASREIAFLQYIQRDETYSDLASQLVQRLDQTYVEKIGKVFDRLSSQINLSMQMECTRILDHILSTSNSVSKFAVENVDLLKSLYSLAYHNGHKFPNFVINDS